MQFLCTILLILSTGMFECGWTSDPDILYSFKHITENTYERTLWPRGIIPVKLASSVARIPRMKDVVKKAMEEWETKTCIIFPERRNETDYVQFEYSDQGCNADVGYRGGKQIIFLDKCGFDKRQVIHEIGHVIGFWHEQSRPDRDNYVYIYKENIRDGHKSAFSKYPNARINTLVKEYDYHSIMHYKMKAYSKNGRYTILPRTEGIFSLGNDQLSPLDIKKTIMLYKCNGWTTWSQWSECNKSCEDGTQKRKRNCTKLNGDKCNGSELQERMCNLGECPEWPTFPADFSFKDFRVTLFSIGHIRAHRHREDECLLIHESEDELHWSNYVFCNRGKRKIHMKWSDKGPIPGMKCTYIFEPKEKIGWSNNYLCVPISSPYNLIWSYDGRKENMSCVKWHAKSGEDGWDDNFLCTKGYKSPIHGSWTTWSSWSECKTQCGKGKRHRQRNCTNPRPQNEGRPCVGSHLDEEECIKERCRHNVCGGALKGTRGNFTSPSFPLNYPSNVNCTWLIKCRPLKHVLLTITSMDIENTMSCMFDYLLIKDENYKGKKLGRFCGSKIPDLIVSASNSLWISFITDGEVNRSGFTATWIHD